MGTRNLFDEDELEQVGADGLVPVSQTLRLAFDEPLRQWAVRILCGVAGLPAFWDQHASIPDVCIGWLSDLLTLDAESVCDREALRQQVLGMRQDLAPQTSMPQDCVAQRNLQWLGASAGLNAVEQQILQFSFAMRAFNSLRSACLTLPNMPRADAPQVLGDILGADPAQVQQAISLRGRLLRSGLISTNLVIDSSLDHLTHMARALSLRIHLHTGDPAGVLDGTCIRLPQPTLKLDNFGYMSIQTELAQRWLKGAIGQVGAHLLVTGAPGLGKTEWVRALIAEQGIAARELAVLGEDGDAISGADRIENLRLCMHLLNGRETQVIVFDEADDAFVLDDKRETYAQSVTNHRAALNRMLEESTVPVIWIMNHPEVLHPAMLRRFDAVIAFAPIPRSLRSHLIKTRLGGPNGWSDAEIGRWADVPGLSAALIERLDRVSMRAHQAGAPLRLEHCRQWIRDRIDPRQLRSLVRGTLPQVWDGALVQASMPPQSLMDAIRGNLQEGRASAVRILLHGPSGTGKTAFARELARQIDRPLLEKRASDLLSAWVGGTEKEIDQAFVDARQMDAVLLIDEVDSFLLRRDTSLRSWEVSMVNELLMQLSDFEGVVVLTTNRMDALDRAVLRRMDLKVAFYPLSADQVITAIERLTEDLGLPPPNADQQLELAQLRHLTVGDLEGLRRRMVFDPLGSDPVDDLIVRLQEEMELKQIDGANHGQPTATH